MLARLASSVADAWHGLVFALEGRSPGWAPLRKKHLQKEPCCQCCLARRDLDVHHIIPVHVDERGELDPANLITLCRRCHLLIGHLGNFQTMYNPEVRHDAGVIRRKILAWDRRTAG